MKKCPIKTPKSQDVPLEAINFAKYNPRTITAAKMKSLKASLLKHGLVLNLVVQKKGMTLIGGHQRVRALRELCKEHDWTMPEVVDAKVLDVDDATAKQLNVTLNNVEGEFDPFRLGELYADMLAGMNQDDVLASGFTSEELSELVAITRPAEDEPEAKAGANGFAKSVTLSVEFDTVENRDRAKKLLAEATDGSGKKPGALLLKLLRGAGALSKSKGEQARA